MTNNNSPREIAIEAGSLVVLSGLPGSGKSSLRANARVPYGAPQEFLDRAWVSSDALRATVQGTYLDLDEYGPYVETPHATGAALWNLLRQIVSMRLSMGLTTLVDATNPTDADRREWAKLAQEHGVPFKVLIVDTSLDECLAANRKRSHRVPESAIHRMNQPPSTPAEGAPDNGKGQTPPQGFMRTSEFPHELVSRDDTLVFHWRRLENSKVDVIGDVHGLLDDFLALLAKAGWVYKDGDLSHPEGRKLLLLGDLVDRGTQSLDLLRLLKRAVKKGVADVLQGNHEHKLLKFYDRFQSEGVSSWGSYANAQTGLELVKAQDGAELAEFLRGLPAFTTYVNENEGLRLFFSHADLIRLEPGVTPRDELMYGQTGFERSDTDAKYEALYRAGLNRWTLFRGHIPQTSEQEHVFSLERLPFEKGELVLMRLDDFEQRVANGATQREAFNPSVLTQRCDFSFEEYRKRYHLSSAMTGLVTHKMAYVQVNQENTLKVFKYSKDTFFRSRWSESQALLKARGLVLDAAGNIVSHPFDKCFNLHENGTGDDLAPETPLVVVDKLNGFLGIISKHPFKANELLVHTQGSFGGDFVGFIRDFLTPECSGRIKRFLSKNDVTLMFEVLHPQDPHIIQYEEKDMGLWLLGVRGKNEQDLAWREDEVDAAAQEMGLRRPSWFRMTKGELIAACRTEDGLRKIEGWMAREDTAEQRHLFKLKTPYYLVTKFVSRLSYKRVSFMFGNPQAFKKDLDEEFFTLVDVLTERTTKEEFLAMPETERVELVGGLVSELI